MSAKRDSIVIKQFVPRAQMQVEGRTKRTRPKVPDEQRKRVRLACETCRQKKDKCDGSLPCRRCSREGIICIPGTASTYSRMSQAERTERLQLVVQYALGITSITDDEIRSMSDTITNRDSPTSEGSSLHLESSLSTFSHQLQQKLGEAHQNNGEHDAQPEADQEIADDATANDAIAEFCRSPSPVVSTTNRFLHSVLAALPAREVAENLCRTCFDKVQCNSFYAQESWMYEQIHRISQAPSTLKDSDAPIVATLLMTMALGSQFSSDPALEPLGHSLYEQTSVIVPELIKRSDLESIRACLLLATYLFPVDHSGHAYTYLGLTLHMAMSKKMHLHCRNEVEVRIWWTLYTFYQRARIFHGHPRTLSHVDVAVRRPCFTFELEPANGVSNFDNQVVLIEITITLEKIADEIAFIRKRRSAVQMARLLVLRRKLVDTYPRLPSLKRTDSMARLRLDIHLYLFYWHARLYPGRPFLLEYSDPSQTLETAHGHADDIDAATKLNSDFDRLENNLRTLQQEQQDSRAHYAHVQEKEHRIRNAVEEHLEGLNTQLHKALTLSPSAHSITDLHEPPRVNGQGYKPQLAYLEESLLNIEHMLRRHGEELEVARAEGGDAAQEIEEIQARADQEVEAAQARADTQTQKMSEYETTVSGLWEILQSDQPLTRSPSFDTSSSTDPPPTPRSPLFESFSLQAFSSRVQHLFDRASSAREQHDILRRQIQQQRELNGKSDAEKDRQIEGLNTKLENLTAQHAQVQEELARAVAYGTESESEASQLRAKMLNIENELDELKRTADARHQEREEMARQLQVQEQEIEELRQQIEDLIDDARMTAVESEANLKESDAKHTDLSTQLAAAVTAREVAEQKHASVNQDMENLENEVVRLTTELAMAKAELDGAYGSRAERAKEAQASEIQALNDQNAQVLQELQSLRFTHSQLEIEAAALRSASQNNARTAELEQELHAMTAEFQDLTRESMQLERERGQLDALIDGLRDRCEALEGQLSDERVRWIGVKSPSTASGGRESMMAREMTSTMVLRQEFKKMMRETRAEGVRLLRAEQEERRKLEIELRRLKHGTGSAVSRGSMLSVNGHGHGHGRGASTASSVAA